MGIELSQLDGAEIDVPDAVRDLAQADDFPSQCLTQIDVAAFPHDAPFVVYSSDEILFGISHLG